MAQQDEDAVEAQDCTAAVELELEETKKELPHRLPTTISFVELMGHAGAYLIAWIVIFALNICINALLERLLGIWLTRTTISLDYKLSVAAAIASVVALAALITTLLEAKKSEVSAGAQDEAAVQARDGATADSSVIKGTEKMPLQLGPGAVFLAEVLAHVAVFLTSWVVLFTVSLGAIALFGWLTEATPFLGFALSVASIIATIFAIMFVLTTLFLASKKPESSDAPGSDS
ncbi:MAG: hypothetical protein WC641_07685 [Patescibacteria group bacterium]